MADERQAASGSDLGKDPVFLVMVTGQIESAEVSKKLKIGMLCSALWASLVPRPSHIFQRLHAKNRDEEGLGTRLL